MFFLLVVVFGWADGTEFATRRAAAPLAYTDVSALRALAARSPFTTISQKTLKA